MKTRSARLALPAALVLALGPELPPRAIAADGAAMFRSDPAHTGRVSDASIVVGGLAWRFATSGKVRSTAAVASGLAVFGSEDGFLYAVAVDTGREVWKCPLGGPVSGSPAIAGDRVVILGSDGVLRALALRDGRPLWTFATGKDVPIGLDPRAFDMFVSSPTVVDGTLFVGGGDGNVHAVDLATGAPRWRFRTGHRVRSTPAVADGAVFVGSFDGKVYSLDASTGTERWHFDTGDVVQSSPSVADGMVFFGSRSMAVFALDAGTGRLLWRRPHSGSWILASPAVVSGKVVIGGSDSHRLEALDAKTGAPLWSIDTGARVLASPAIAGDVVLYSAEDYRVYAADLETGLGLSWDFTESALYSSPVLAQGFVLVGSDDNHLYAFRTAPRFPLRDGADAELLRAAVGRYATDAGTEFTLSLHQGRLRVDHASYPPGLAIVSADGSFVCPHFFGLRGRIERQAGQPAAALRLQLFGEQVTAKRVE